MTLEEISAKMRQVRSEMPKRTSEQAYAQMARLMKTTGTIQIEKKPRSTDGLKRKD